MRLYVAVYNKYTHSAKYKERDCNNEYVHNTKR